MLADARNHRPAAPFSRALALGLDAALIASLAGLGLILASRLGIGQYFDLASRVGAAAPDPTTGVEARLDAALVERLVLGLYVAGAVVFGAPILLAWRLARSAATPGKAILSLTVRDFATGGAPPFGRALVREILRLAHVPFFLAPSPFMTLLGMGLCAGLAVDLARNRASRTWYDRATSTIVLAPPPPAPEGAGDEDRA